MKISVFDSDVEALANWRRIAKSGNLQFTGQPSFDGFQSSLADDTQIIVVDVSMAQGDFATHIAAYCQNYRQHIFVATAPNFSVQQTVQFMRHCAAWVFEKPLIPNLVQTALTHIIKDAHTVADKLCEYKKLQNSFDRLTDREKQVLKLILDGIANKDAAALLKISVRTVEARRAKVYLKTGADNLAGLMRKVELLERYRRRFTRLQKDQDLIPDHHLNFGSSLHHKGAIDNRTYAAM